MTMQTNTGKTLPNPRRARQVCALLASIAVLASPQMAMAQLAPPPAGIVLGVPDNGQAAQSPLAPPPSITLELNGPAASPSGRWQTEPFRVGFLADPAPEHQRTRMIPFVRHLEGIVQRPVDLIAYPQSRGLVFALDQDQLDYVIAPSALLATAHLKCACLVPLALQPVGDGALGYFSTIATRADGAIGSIDDLVDRQIVVVGEDSLVAHQMGFAELSRAGRDLPTPQDAVYVPSMAQASDLVMDGQADAILYWSQQETGHILFDQAPASALSSEDRGRLRIIWRSRPLVATSHAYHGALEDEMAERLSVMLERLHSTNGDAFYALDEGSGRPFARIGMDDYQPFFDAVRYWNQN